MIPKVTEILTSSIGSLVSITYGAVTLTGNVLLAFIISIYILVEKEKFTEMSKKLFILSFAQKMRDTYCRLHDYFMKTSVNI